MLRSLINVSGDALDYGGHVLLSGLVKIFKFLILYMFSKMSTFEMKKKKHLGCFSNNPVTGQKALLCPGVKN